MDATAEPSLTIGQFAQRSGLSYKALRIYDRSGLLPPARVDPDTGYRRYRPEQLARARQISLLRQLGIPLATIAEVLDEPRERATWMLERWWAQEEAAMQARRGAYEYIREHLGRADLATEPKAPVRLREVPETKVASIQRAVDQSTLVQTMTAAWKSIRGHLLDVGADPGAGPATAGTVHGAEPGAERWWIYHGLVTPDSVARVEVCVPFTGATEPAGEIAIRIEPAHTEAYRTVAWDECSYPRIMAAYDDVATWVRRSEREAIGPPREIYFAYFEDVAAHEPFAHVAQPITGGM